MLTLRRLLEMVADYEHRVEVAIETKHPTRYAGLVEKRLVEMLRDFGWDRAGAPVRVMSFSFTALQRVERLAPDVQAGAADRARAVLADAAPGDRQGLDRRAPASPSCASTPSWGARITKAGHDIHVWTVNTPEDLQLCLDLGVKAVITDRPAYIRELLERPISSVAAYELALLVGRRAAAPSVGEPRRQLEAPPLLGDDVDELVDAQHRRGRG